MSVRASIFLLFFLHIQNELTIIFSYPLDECGGNFTCIIIVSQYAVVHKITEVGSAFSGDH